MKKFLFSSFFLLSSLMIFCQNYPKPDFKNQPMLVVDGKLDRLEKQTAEIKMKVKALGYGGAQQQLSVPGGTSPVKVSTKPEFLIWVDEGVDPESIIILTKTVFKKKKRSIPMMKVSAFAAYGATGKSMSGKYHVPFDIEKVQEGVYKITPSSDLEANTEYAFYNPEKTNAQQTKIYLFGTN